MVPKRVEDAMGEMVEESSKEDETTEAQFSGTATASPYHSLSKPDEVFNFWLTGPLTNRKWISTFG